MMARKALDQLLFTRLQLLRTAFAGTAIKVVKPGRQDALYMQARAIFSVRK